MKKKAVRSAIDNETRTRILVCLGTGTKTVNELCSVCSMSQSAVSQHLMKLRASGAVESVRKGREQLYRATDRRLVELCRSIINLTRRS